MQEDKLKDANFFVRNKFFLVCLACFFLSLSSLFINSYIFIVYMLLVTICAFAFNVNELIIFSSFGAFFAKCFEHNIFIVTLILPLFVKILIRVFTKQLEIKKHIIIPITIIITFFIMLFLINFNKNNMLRTFLPILLSLSLELFLLRDEIDLVFLVKNLVRVLFCSYLVALVFYKFNIGIAVIHIDVKKIKRFFALMPHINTVSIWCVALISQLMVLFFQKKISYLCFYFYTLFLMVAGILTVSKTFMVISVLLLLVYLIILTKRNWKFGILQIGLVFAAIIVVCLCFPDVIQTIIKRFTAYRGSLLDSITTGRNKLWTKGLNVWSKNLKTVFLGVGGSYDFNLHNSYIEILVKYGVLGILLVFAFSAYFIILLKRNFVCKFINFIPLSVILLYMLVEEFSTGQFVAFALSLFSIYSFTYKKPIKSILSYYNLDSDISQKIMMGTIRKVSNTCHIDIITCSSNKQASILNGIKLMNCGCGYHNLDEKKGRLSFYNLIRFFKQNKGKYDVIYINATSMQVGLISYAARVYGGIDDVVFNYYRENDFDKKLSFKSNVGRDLAKIYSTKLWAYSYADAKVAFGQKYCEKSPITIIKK